MRYTSDNTYILLPAYLEEPAIRPVILNLHKHGYRHIIVVDDGSPDHTYDEVMKCPQVLITRHLLNRGKGAAVRTGMEIAKQYGAQAVVTFDADGQHDPEDIEPLLQKLSEGYDIVLGVRAFDPAKMPRSKIIANNIGNFVTWILFGIKTSDSQSGLRVFSRKAIDLIETKADRYSHETEVLKEIKRHRLSYTEVPIQTIYTRHSETKAERQSFITGIKTLIKLIASV